MTLLVRLPLGLLSITGETVTVCGGEGGQCVGGEGTVCGGERGQCVGEGTVCVCVWGGGGNNSWTLACYTMYM